MKTLQIVCAALVAAFSVSAFAQNTVRTDAERDRANLNARNNYPVIKFESTKTRADVRAELEAARLGEPAKAQGPKPSATGSPAQGKAFDSSLYNGA
ncbi:DUF4148 domain-containing protein [Herbaspirillum robiniae]|uniref:DUF4148 domain-containing protein n=1 Tax=Herbaspirillum robiniae TaxID=2014887 RepID=A0A246WS90_9BURK|nr:DUF4148 domain-containing protein [Herbaspirillum robiniae]OWY28523.1 DUF4148 domain-containing protein [Herbaspirillum robiniae]